MAVGREVRGLGVQLEGFPLKLIRGERDGHDLTRMGRGELRRMRPWLQMVFQDPISSLNPRRRVGDAVTDPLVIAGRGDRRWRIARVKETLEAVGLDPVADLARRPHEFSGCQCQRICISRALVLEPRLLICSGRRRSMTAGGRERVFYDPFLPEVRLDPYPLYRQLRASEPVQWNPHVELWTLTRYADVAAVKWYVTTPSTQACAFAGSRCGATHRGPPQ